MDLVAVNNTLATPSAQALARIEDRIDNGYQFVKIARVALGDAPISLGTTAIGALLRAFQHEERPRTTAVITDAGLVADGLLRGLFYQGGLLHHAAARRVPWLVTPRAAPAGWGGVARLLGRVAGAARTALLGISGVLGAMRAAHAVSEGGVEALYRTRAGRSGMLQALGSALLIIPHPVARLAGAAVFAAEIANEFS